MYMYIPLLQLRKTNIPDIYRRLAFQVIHIYLKKMRLFGKEQSTHIDSSLK